MASAQESCEAESQRGGTVGSGRDDRDQLSSPAGFHASGSCCCGEVLLDNPCRHSKEHEAAVVRIPLDLGHHLCRKPEVNAVPGHVGDLDVLHEDEVDWLPELVRGLGEEGYMVADRKAGRHSL